MEMRKENNENKRRRKVLNRPTLVRSVKAGQALSATYSRETNTTSSFASLWKS
ncbi:hypothetical protein [Flavisolibacter tropicus]|uniref:hypothetical protein n=1 Tax=Flavisolibacter tropicus TaxID=1492898 RepID=UPI0013147952|nr:hypothetical protein [Flavisolibacter tropicus]